MEDNLPPEFWQGAEQFNQGEFYACHDTFEALWTEALEPDRTFYQGLLQIAVGLYHLGNHNWQGAATLLGEAHGRLRPYEENYGGVDLNPVREQAKTIWLRLHSEGKDQVGAIAAELGLGNISAMAHDSPPSMPPVDRDRVALPRIEPWSEPL
jgi:uncharacterized protein